MNYLPFILLVSVILLVLESSLHVVIADVRKKEINHTCATIAFLFWVMVWGFLVNHFFGVSIGFAAYVFGIFSRLSIHDYSMNIMRGKDLEYRGDEINKALTDKILTYLYNKNTYYPAIARLSLFAIALFTSIWIAHY